ncbi:hypothetical protein AVEN_52756-1 [Araneus ventricosus]|uniref:Uncharacterized protein n=1 Tax=Araneus ventricosus TaxID=182803 RepID=A0A4Y2CW06_ARAVE|nr:hypothetical protein AVEN_52756-1 [Araneus ventricosus]
MQTPERYEHALNCYHTTYRRSGALRQWFDQVLNTTISKDLAEITEESKAKAQELRQERIHLIKQKVKEITGKDVDFDARSLDTEAEDLAADEQVAKLFEAERLEGKSQNFLTANSTLPPAPTPVPVSDLAPMPTNEEIFGKLFDRKKFLKSNSLEYQFGEKVFFRMQSFILKLKAGYTNSILMSIVISHSVLRSSTSISVAC